MRSNQQSDMIWAQVCDIRAVVKDNEQVFGKTSSKFKDPCQPPTYIEHHESMQSTPRVSELLQPTIAFGWMNVNVTSTISLPPKPGWWPMAGCQSSRLSCAGAALHDLFAAGAALRRCWSLSRRLSTKPGEVLGPGQGWNFEVPKMVIW